jgi:transketolase
VVSSVKKTGCAVTAEEHMMNGGLGDSIAQVLARRFPVPVEMVAVKDMFGISGKPDELMKKFGLDSGNIVDAALSVLSRKK